MVEVTGQTDTVNGNEEKNQINKNHVAMALHTLRIT